MKTRILGISTLILAIGTISLCFRNIQLRNRLMDKPTTLTKIDTVYIDKIFKVEEPYEEYTKPDNVSIFTKGLGKSNTTLPQSTKRDSVVQFKLSKTSLDLTLYNLQDSTVHTDAYQIDLNKYKYLYNNGILTQKKTTNLRFFPFLQVRARPINRFFDLSGGLSLQSNHFTYSLGIGLGYYPKLSDKLYKDLEISATYNF